MDSLTVPQAQVTANSTLSEVLDDLCVRFILYIPEEELRSAERICYHIEMAHWYYEDFVREHNSGLPNLTLKNFIHQIFNHIPQSLISHIPVWKAETHFTDYLNYKQRVPVRGAIILNMTMDKVLLVRGWKNSASWSFPRGKIDQDEGDFACAVREVEEETGYTIDDPTRENDYVQRTIGEQDLKFYIIPGVPEDTKFECKTRKEIGKIEWYKLSDMPGYKGKRPAGRYYMVHPFMEPLRKWISTKGQEWLKAKQSERRAQMRANNVAVGGETKIDRNVLPASSVSMNDSAGLKSLLGISGKAAEVKEHEPMAPNQQEEASLKLKQMLNLNTPKPEDNAGKLKNLLGGNAADNATTTAPTVQPNAKALLSILQSGSPGPEALPQAPRPASQNNATAMGHTPSMVADSTYRTNTPQRAPLAPVVQNSAPSQSYNGWPRAYQPSNHHLPSPPPTGMFDGPPPPSNHHQHRNSMPHMQNYAPSPKQLPYPTSARNEIPQPVPHYLPPPTPMEGFQPPIPTRPPDPGQTGALLSILKGGGAPVQAPQAAPQPSVSKTPSRMNPPAEPSKPISLQAPPPPRGPKAQTPRMKTVANFADSAPRPSTSAPPRHNFAPPPPRPNSAHPPPHRPTPPPRTPQSPVVIDYYGTPKTSTLPRANFDRRDSVSNAQASTLLSMFRKPSLPSGVPPVATNGPPNGISSGLPSGPPRVPFDRRESVNKEQANALLAMFRSPSTPSAVLDGSAIASSPEIEKATPAPRTMPPTAGRPTQTMKGKGKSPLGQDKRDDLLKFLESVS